MLVILELKILSFVEDIKYHLGAKQNILLDFQLYADSSYFPFEVQATVHRDKFLY